MFTGLIEQLGTIAAIDRHAAGARIVVEAAFDGEPIATGESIAVNGVCLTALDPNDLGFAADLSPETLDRTSLGSINIGSRVNLERAMLATTRLGGHIVQGHVDGRGEFISATEDGEFWTVRIGFPDGLARYFVEKGSVCVDGISLTIARLDNTSFDIAVIPKTWELTNLSKREPGDAVNLEVDIIAKYVERMFPLRS